VIKAARLLVYQASALDTIGQAAIAAEKSTHKKSLIFKTGSYEKQPYLTLSYRTSTETTSKTKRKRTQNTPLINTLINTFSIEVRAKYRYHTTLTSMKNQPEQLKILYLTTSGLSIRIENNRIPMYPKAKTSHPTSAL
jgi:hypothetical protein